MNEFLHYLTHLPLVWVYIIIFLAAYIENLFPPSPSDAAVVIGGAVTAMNGGSPVISIMAAALGSTLGFMTMYIIGSWLGVNYIERKNFKYFPKEGLHRVEQWFARYGYWIIIANRFLAGTRAVVSFFAGLSQLDLGRTTLLSFASSFFWYAILVYGGYSLGRKWERFGYYLETYSLVITWLMVLVAAVAAIVYYWKRRGRRLGETK